MSKKWRNLTRRFYRATRRQFHLTVVPPGLLQALQPEADGDQTYPKLPFAVFVNFMVRAILAVRNKPSSRRLARRSRHPSIQRLACVPSISHQAICDRLRTVHLPTLQTVFQQVSQAICRVLGRGFRRRGGLRLFDCSSIEVGSADYEWAANNGDKNVVRLALGLHGGADVPSVLLDASDTTSDNSIFPAIVNTLEPRTTVVLDAGFTRLVDFRRIMEAGAHFVARMANIYHVQTLHRYQLPAGGRRRVRGWILWEDARVLVGTPASGGPLEARRTIWLKFHLNGAASLRAIWTDRFDLTPKRLFQIDQIRWRIEVQFRWLKSELGLDHLPTQDFQGVQAFFLLVMLAWLVLRVFSARQCGIPVDQFSCAAALDAWDEHLEYYLLGETLP